MARTAPRPSRRAFGRSPPRGWDLPKAVHVYPDPSSATLDGRAVAGYLQETLGIRTTIRGEFFEHGSPPDLESLARRIAATKVRHFTSPFEPMDPLYGEVQFELRLLREPTKRVPGILYDALRYTSLLRTFLPREEANLRTVHIIFGHRLVGTFDEDGRYHARTVVCGLPSYVSTSGLVEAPAKPKEYYKVKAQLSLALGAVPFDAAKEPFRGQFLDYDDSRLTEVAKGYALQAAMYQITKEAFCPDPGCRLFNAHWQSELLRAQIESGRMCAHHAAAAKRIREMARIRKG